MKTSVYLETTIPSYLVAWRSNNLIMAANQEATKEWWDTCRNSHDLFSSMIVRMEVSAGDPQAASRRLSMLEGIPELDVSEEVEILAKILVENTAIPAKAATDAVHIALATIHQIDYLLTWNCTHIANAAMRRKIEAICRNQGYEPSIICTPLELLQE